MDCESALSDEVVERYARGALAPQEVEAFELHYFGCERCFERLETFRAMSAALRETAPASRPRLALSSRAWAVAAALILAVGVTVLWRAVHPREPVATQASGAALPAPTARIEPPPSSAAPRKAPAGPVTPLPAAGPRARADRIAELARFEPPSGELPVLRDVSDDVTARFREAMERYRARDYEAAAEGLRQVPPEHARGPDASFFLAICQMESGRTREAVAQLRRTIALGESPYLEDARFFLSVALLRQQDVAGAMRELGRAIALHGSREAAARNLLEALRALEPRQ